MKKEEKIKVIDDLTSKLKETKTLYFTDISGLNASQTTALRRACHKINVKLSVVKNTMLSRAMDASDKDFGEIKDVLKGNTSLMFSETGNLPAKVIKDFADIGTGGAVCLASRFSETNSKVGNLKTKELINND